MNKIRAITYSLVVAVIFQSLGVADDIVLSNGTVYKNATIVKFDKVNATIMYDDGGASVPISSLAPALQKKLGYSPEEAQAELDTEALNEAKAKVAKLRAELLSENQFTLSGKVIQVLPDGIIAEVSSIVQKEVTQRVTTIEPVDVIPVGKITDVVRENTTTRTRVETSAESMGTVFVMCDTSDLVDNQSWCGVAWRTGTYHYTNTMNAPATVPKFTVSADDAYKYIIAETTPADQAGSAH